MPSPFQRQEHCYLYRYFGSNILPRLVRRDSLARYADQSYMLRLALEFPPLMGALVSIAGMQLASLNRWPISEVVGCYIQTLAGLRQTLTRTSNIDPHDALLATVVTLAVFESSRIDAAFSVAHHVTASGILVTKRRVRRSNCPQATAVFNRICIESFVYHASLMMIFDPSLDSLSDTQCRQELSNFFSGPEQSDQCEPEQTLSTQPILHVSYKFFLLVADATKLARKTVALTSNEICEWVQLQEQSSKCVAAMARSQDQCTVLYALALRTLLLKSQPDITLDLFNDGIDTCIRESNKIKPHIDASPYFTSFLLWPLAILGSVSTLSSEIKVARNFICLLGESRLGGQAHWVLRRLETIWSWTSTVQPSSADWRVAGLQSLLDGENHNQTLQHPKHAFMRTCRFDMNVPIENI
ncbi:fungal Zn binuclear cluster domain-containing protein [Penicillium malachiteum]|uniref:fungal Zn binuclear cluster domain-containing protein n=1 Tax=Penicillium malachiteum TaxID=1324776 RepID=UPI0025470E81|nr:fungal Zn binuclear cluster domain-containing protein [Penicillium malachiteum]KAJ5737854.1 fungal Zn binuclear cluster domain-containing protein [Penicillium malachiteum]